MAVKNETNPNFYHSFNEFYMVVLLLQNESESVSEAHETYLVKNFRSP